MNPKISIVLPAYKKRFLANSIQSILNQTYKNYELIIVNDCSPEDLDSICNSFVDDRIQYYKNSNNMGGKDLIKCWNHCIQYATGEYLILASDDDIYEEEFLETIVELSQKRPEVNFEDIKEFVSKSYDHEVIDEVEINIKYEGYIKKQEKEAEKMLEYENVLIPEDFDYQSVQNLALEAREKLNKIHPTSIGQAMRISGVNPADISILMIELKRRKYE